MSTSINKSINLLADDLAAIFTPPEMIVGCEVLDITDINEYAQGNGWIEALVGQHNQQRIRWKSNEIVQVGDFVDVIYFPDRRLFEAWGLGGSSTPAISGVAANITVDTTNFDKNLSAADDTVQKALETLDELSNGGTYTLSYGDATPLEFATIPGAQTLDRIGLLITTAFDDAAATLELAGFFDTGEISLAEASVIFEKDFITDGPVALSVTVSPGTSTQGEVLIQYSVTTKGS